MDFALTDEQELTQRMVREFAESEVRPVAAAIDRDHSYPPELLSKIAEMGLFGVPFPEEVGGSGGDQLSYTIVVEELSRECASTGVIVAAHTSLGVWPIYTFGTDEQKQRYLPDLTSGKKLAAFGLTEPGAGTDAGAVATTAELQGDEYILNGSKIFITNGGIAEVYVVFASTDPTAGSRGLSAFIVEKGTPGFSFGESERKLGIHGTDTLPLFFSDVHIPKTALLGEVGQGFKIAMQTLDGGRIGVAAQALGIAQAALDAAVDYAKQRVQFKKPIAALQAIQWMVADMAVDVESARLLVYRAACLKAEGKPYGKESAIAKLFAAEASERVTSKAIQILGGYGYTEAYPVERYYRDARITQIYEGTSEAQRIVISRAFLR